MKSADDSLVELRCAVAIIRRDAVLVLQRDSGDWVLPGGRPHPHESMGSCVRRETREETGLDIQPTDCALVLEVNDPRSHRRIVELVFVADQFDPTAPTMGEPGRTPMWVAWADLKDLALRPPIAGFLRDLSRGGGKHARYLGNLWRPGPVVS
ncbi:NUDIX hydrolase [Mycobacterium sp. 94-17]|uniref:NUDIX hydrolase n=1 Tax=Mycobacterium sp. 94-17 TaxID=2986147 RepID=UPI002D1E96E0|nr:NUDIX hydrolase [Mycobacterium sp. 94-17]MEB4211211.1 NUDIX hydrolase [Mycobacterium sp. 94-17]